jgi:formylglycine-generating enzyme required for sulfatase activity
MSNPNHLLLLALLIAARCTAPLAGAGQSSSQTRETTNRDKDIPAQSPETVVNSIGMKLVPIPAGSFMMGSREDDPDHRTDELPRHRVRITRPFYLGAYEVTQAEFGQVMGVRKSFFSADGPGKDKVAGHDTSKFPAEQVTWHEAIEFCRRLSDNPAEKKAGRTYRLPTEAEWEYACRAGTSTLFSFGDSLASTQANFNGNYPFGDALQGPFRNRTMRVGSFQPNAFGLYDMHGNVWEWCFDRYGLDFYKSSPTDDPQGPAVGSRRVIRGGDWYSDGRDCRSAFRYADVPAGTFYALGMRVVMTTDGRELKDDRPAAAAVTTELAEGNTIDNSGEEWPRWRGPRGDGTWQGPPLPERWPAEGLRRIWRQPVAGGYGGVAVSGGRVYVMDRIIEPEEQERLLCFDATTGKLLWRHQYAVHYGDLPYGNGPRTTPTIYDGRVYALGALGHLWCLDAASGDPLWSIDLVAEYGARVPLWGVSASPFVYENSLIVLAGGPNERCLLALNRMSGEPIWSGLSDEAGYATPLVIQHRDTQQLVCWTPTSVHGVNPRDGALLWTIPFEVNYGTSIASPLFREGIVLVSNYYDGSKAIRLGPKPSDAEIIWEDRRNLRGLMAQALYRDGYGYLLDKRHGLTCFEFATGHKRWDDENRMTPKGRNPQATMVWIGQEERAIVLNSDGELILARLNPEGYSEQSRTPILGETWAHPAYAGSRVYARSDREIVCVSLLEGAGK